MAELDELVGGTPENDGSKEPKAPKLEVVGQRLSGARRWMASAARNVSWRSVGLVAGGVTALAAVGAVVLKKRRG